MKQYNTYSFIDKINWQAVPEEKLSYFLWDSAAEYKVYFKMCFLKNKGIYLKMSCDETDFRAVGRKRDDRVWEDSCMELFICPIETRQEYLNFEINCDGVYLSQFGAARENRTFIKEITSFEPTIKTQKNSDGWRLELFIPCELISEVFKEEFTAGASSIKGNFTKCGDLTKYPHYGSFSELGALTLGFHNPQCFAKINIDERYYDGIR